MSQGVNYLHSHSALERDMKFKKYEVLVDEEFKDMFDRTQQYVYKGTVYYRVNTLEFVKKGGIFKNFAL